MSAGQDTRLFKAEAFEQMPGQMSMATDEEWRDARAAAAPLQRGTACVFTYDGRTMSGEIDEINSCGTIVWGREDGRRHLVGAQDVRRETTWEQERRDRLGYYVEDDPERES
jgi:hypothetical protein